MKSLEELKALRDKAQAEMGLRQEADSSSTTRIVVGMATCGIAAGARPVLSALVEAVSKEKIENVVVGQTGCIGICQYEPVVEIYSPTGEKTTYVNMTAEKALEVVKHHIKEGKVVSEYTVGEQTK